MENYIGNVPVDPGIIPDDSVLSSFPILSNSTHASQHMDGYQSIYAQQAVFQKQHYLPPAFADHNFTQAIQQPRTMEDPNFPLPSPNLSHHPPTGNLLTPLPSCLNPTLEANNLQTVSSRAEFMTMQTQPIPSSNSSHFNPNAFPVSSFSPPQAVHNYSPRLKSPNPNCMQPPSRSQGSVSGMESYGQAHLIYDGRQAQNPSTPTQLAPYNPQHYDMGLSQGMCIFPSSQNQTSVTTPNSVPKNQNQRSGNNRFYENVSPARMVYPSSPMTHNQRPIPQQSPSFQESAVASNSFHQAVNSHPTFQSNHLNLESSSSMTQVRSSNGIRSSNMQASHSRTHPTHNYIISTLPPFEDCQKSMFSHASSQNRAAHNTNASSNPISELNTMAMNQPLSKSPIATKPTQNNFQYPTQVKANYANDMSSNRSQMNSNNMMWAASRIVHDNQVVPNTSSLQNVGTFQPRYSPLSTGANAPGVAASSRMTAPTAKTSSPHPVSRSNVNACRPSPVSRSNVNAPGPPPPLRPSHNYTISSLPRNSAPSSSPVGCAPSSRVLSSYQGAPVTRGTAPSRARASSSAASSSGAASSSKAASSSRAVATSVRGASSMRGGTHPPPVSRGARYPAYCAPSARGGISTRGIPSGRGPSSDRGRTVTQDRGRSRGATSDALSRGPCISNRGARGRGRGRGAFIGVTSSISERERTQNNQGPPSQNRQPNVDGANCNIIQWYRLPDPAPSSFQSDIEAMRASVTSEPMRVVAASSQSQNNAADKSAQEPADRNISSQKEKPSSQKAQHAEKSAVSGSDYAKRIKQEVRQQLSHELNTTVSKSIAPSGVRDNVPSVNAVSTSQGNGEDMTNVLSNSSIMREPTRVPSSESAPSQKAGTNGVSKSTVSNSTSDGKEQRNSQNLPCRNDSNVTNSKAGIISSGPAKPADKSKELDSQTSESSIQDKKPVISARDKMFNMWRAGQVVGRAPINRRNKAKMPSSSVVTSSKKRENQSDVVIDLIEDSSHSNNKGQTETENIEKSKNELNRIESVAKDQVKTDRKNLFYVLFHGHKLLCFSTAHGNTVLVCQFQYECFPDKGKGSVSNCINRALRIKKKVLDHPSKEMVIKFLKNNGFLKSMSQEQLADVINLDDARRVYHYIYNISRCSLATCVVEVLNQPVDLNAVITPSKRKVLTQEMKMRIKREKKSADDEKYGKSQQQSKAGTTKQRDSVEMESSSIESGGSDRTMLYGQDDSDDIEIIEGPEDPYLLKWDGKQTKTGGVCNTIVGRVRFYQHEKENYLGVSDLCRILGTSEFMKCVESDNVILYSCSKDILSFLNGIDDNFPRLDTGMSCLVKEKDLGVCSTDSDNHQTSSNNNTGPAGSLKRPLCKQEVVGSDDEGSCSSAKQPCLPQEVEGEPSCDVLRASPKAPGHSIQSIKQEAVKEKGPKEKRSKAHENIFSVIQEMSVNNSSKNTELSDSVQSKGVLLGSENTQRTNVESNVIMCFDVNKSLEKNDGLGDKQKETAREHKDTMPSPDSCISVLSQDNAPPSPSVLHHQKDALPSSEKINSVSLSSSANAEISKSKSSPVDKNSENTSDGNSPQNVASTSTAASTAADKTTKHQIASNTDQDKSKLIVATVIDKNSLPIMRKTNVKITLSQSDGKLTNSPNSTNSKHLPQPISINPSAVLQNISVSQQSLSTQGPPVNLRKKYFEDDSVLSQLHQDSDKGLEQYKSRQSLIDEMTILRLKNRTLQENLKCLRDQLKKSKSANEKSGKLVEYYQSVIMEITAATFKDGDKVDSGLPQQPSTSTEKNGDSATPIVIDDD